ncbi:MAG: DoxX family protein [Chitinophagaceae bacterium]|nr:MAG: DoxX family protein [Chitinophagaceae bacterium]
MGILHQIDHWSATHHPRWLVVLRVALGLCLIIKGIAFMSNTVILESLISSSNVINSVSWMTLLITWLHLLCGSFIVTGLLTRVSCLVMIPILAAAVFFVNAPKGFFAADSEFGYSLAVLLLLIFFFIEGGGPLSLDHYFRNKETNHG